MSTPQQIESCRHLLAAVAVRQLDSLTTSDRIMVCEAVASLYPPESKEAQQALQHAEALRSIERQQLLLAEIIKPDA